MEFVVAVEAVAIVYLAWKKELAENALYAAIEFIIKKGDARDLILWVDEMKEEKE